MPTIWCFSRFNLKIWCLTLSFPTYSSMHRMYLWGSWYFTSHPAGISVRLSFERHCFSTSHFLDFWRWARYGEGLPQQWTCLFGFVSHKNCSRVPCEQGMLVSSPSILLKYSHWLFFVSIKWEVGKTEKYRTKQSWEGGRSEKGTETHLCSVWMWEVASW